MKKGNIELTQEDAENTPAGGVVVGKRDGQTMIYDDASLGGYFVGKLHSEGGIKMINKSTGQPLEVQGSEVIITAPAVNDQTKHNFNGKQMTNREILSKINSDGGGVSFADGGDIPAKIHTTDKEYEYGGKMVHDSDIANSLGMNSTLKKGKQHFSSGGKTYDVDAIYNAVKKGKLRLKTKEVETFAMKYPVYDKKYSETAKIDFRKPNGITVRTESGEEVLIDGNHRMNNAYLKGKKTMKTYYIEDPMQIANFTKKSRVISDKYKNKMASSTAKKEIRTHYNMRGDAFDDRKDSENWTKYSLPYDTRFDIEFKNGGHLSSGKSLKQIAEMHNVSLTHINEQLAKGLEVEKEHFADFKERTRVAKDHLVENPNYYSILEKAGLKYGGKFDDGGSVSQENEFAFNRKSKRLKSFYKTNNPSIDKLLIDCQPFIAELIEKQKEIVIKETQEKYGVAMPMNEYDLENYEIGLIFKMVQSFNKYLKVTDVLSDAKIQKHSDLFEISATVTRDGRKYSFYTELIPAGGYNIQEFHYRYITKTDLPESRENSAVENIKSKMGTLKKIQTIDEDIVNYNNRIKRTEEDIKNGFRLYKIQGVENKRVLDESDIVRERNNLKSLEKEIQKLESKKSDLESVFGSLEKKGVGVNFGKEVKEAIGRKLLIDRLRASKYKETGDTLEFKIETRSIRGEKISENSYSTLGQVNTFTFTDEGDGLCTIKAGLELRGKYTLYAEFNNVPLTDIRLKINEIFKGEFEKYLKNGGELEKEDLVENSKKGDTPARDLNNYNDIMDLEADGAVGGDSGLAFADGGQISELKIGDIFKIDSNSRYGGLSLYVPKDDTTYSFDNGTELKLVRLDSGGDEDYKLFSLEERGEKVIVSIGNTSLKQLIEDRKSLKKVSFADGGNIDNLNLNELLELTNNSKFVDGGATNLPKVEKIIITRDLRSDQAYKRFIGTEYYNFEDLKEAIKKAYDEEMLLKPTMTNNGGFEFKVNDTEKNTPTFFFYFNNKKNTVANFNPSTGKAPDLQKQLLKNKKVTYPKYDWTDFFEGASNNTVGKGKTVDGVNVIYFDTNGKDKITQFVGNPIQLYNFLKKLFNDNMRYAEIQPSGNGIVEYPKSIPITNGVWQDLLFVKPEKEAIEAIMNTLAFALFPKLDFTKFNNRYTTITNSKTSAKPLLTDLSNTKIWIGDNPEMSKRVQERAFELGWGWGTSRSTTPENTTYDCLFFSDTQYITASSGKGIFDRSSYKEIFADDLFLSSMPVSANTQPFDFTDTKIDVKNNPALSIRVQKQAFENGWEWESGKGKNIDLDPFNYLYFTKKSISEGSGISSFNNSPKREITEQEIFGSQTSASTSDKITKFNVVVENSSYPDIEVNNVSELFSALEQRVTWDSTILLKYKTPKAGSKKFGLYFRDNPDEYYELKRRDGKVGFDRNYLSEKVKEWFPNEVSEDFFKTNKSDKEVTSINISYETNGNPTYYSGLRTGKDFIEAINYVEQYNPNKDVSVKIDVAYKAYDNSGNFTTERAYEYLTFGKGAFMPSNWTVAEIKSIVSDDWFLNVLNFDNFFSDIVSVGSTLSNPNKIEPYDAYRIVLNWKDNSGKDVVDIMDIFNGVSGAFFISRLKEIEEQSQGKDVEVRITVFADDDKGNQFDRNDYFTIGENWFKPSTRTNEQIKSVTEEWIDGVNFDKYFADVIPLAGSQNFNFKLDPNEVGLVTLTYKDKNGTDVQTFSYKGSDFITELEKIETDGQGVGIEVDVRAYSTDANGKTFNTNDYITVGGNNFRPIGKTPEVIKFSIGSWFQGLNFDKFFDSLVPFNINAPANTKKEVKTVEIFVGLGNEIFCENAVEFYDALMEFENKFQGKDVGATIYVEGKNSSTNTDFDEEAKITIGENYFQPSELGSVDNLKNVAENWFGKQVSFSNFFNSVSAQTNAPAMAQPFDFSDTKIWIGDNPELSRRVQEKAFESGYKWNGLDRYVQNTERKDLYFNGAGKTVNFGSSDRNVFDKTTYFREITEQDIFGTPNTTSKSGKEKIRFLALNSGSGGYKNVSNLTEIKDTIERIFSADRSNDGSITLFANGLSGSSFTINYGDNRICETCYDIQTDGNKRIQDILLSYEDSNNYDWSDFFENEVKSIDINFSNPQYRTDYKDLKSEDFLDAFKHLPDNNPDNEDIAIRITANYDGKSIYKVFTATVYPIDPNNPKENVISIISDEKEVKDFLKKKLFPELNFDKYFGDIPSSKSVVPKSIADKQFTDLKEAVSALEGFASKASEKYNTTDYEEGLQLLKGVKDDYSFALSFTPESSFMYERIELMKKIAEIQKEITRITELKSGGAYYILSKVIERLERGEDWKESGRGEIMTNEVPQQELDSVIHTDKFKNWFGNWEKALITKEYDYVSKAITESGKPSVMYHGAKRIKFSYRQVSNGVLYLAENRSYAEWFSANESPYQKQGDYLTQCFVNIKNPIDLTPLGVEEFDLRDIIRFIDALYPLAKIYDVLQPNTAMAIMNNNLIGGQLFRAWNIIRQYPKLNEHIRDNTSYDGFIYYENNPSDMTFNQSTGNIEQNVTKATAVFNSNQVKLVDAMLFDSSLDDWRFETGGKVN
jgi:predicted  nucleic acid-binding Zn-ribbon protein